MSESVPSQHPDSGEAESSGPAAAVAERREFLASCLLLAGLIAAIYHTVVTAGFVWDDELVIINRESLSSWSKLVGFWFDPANSLWGDYWPLSYTSHWIEYQFWGLNPAGYHIVNVAFHLLNSILLLYILRRLKMRGALLASVLFAVHPMQVSSVAWVVERKDLLCSLFYFLTFLAWFRFEERSTAPRYLTVVLMFAASMVSKIMSASWPAAAVIYCWWRRGRVEVFRVAQILPILVIGLPLAFLVRILRGSPVPPAELKFTLAQKVILVGKNLCFYAYKLVWPFEHVPLYPRWTLEAGRPSEYLGAFAVAAALILLWLFRKRTGRGPLAAALYYIVSLSPILGMVYWSLLNKTYVQDHYQYTACIGPFLAFAYVFDKWAPRLFRSAANPRFLAYGALAPLFIVPLGALAYHQALLYQNRMTLFQENYRRYPDSAKPVYQYAETLVEYGRHEEALPVIEKAIALDPKYAQCWKLKGDVFFNRGDMAEAKRNYEKVLAMDPEDVITMNNFAIIYLRQTPPDARAAIGLLERALRRSPEKASYNGNYAIALYLAGRKDEARPFFEKSLGLTYGTPASSILYYYALLLLDCGLPERALPFARAACDSAQNQNPEYNAALAKIEAALKGKESAPGTKKNSGPVPARESI